MKSLSCVRLFATPWAVAHQAPLSMGFSRQEYWSGLPFPSPGDLPDPGIEPRSPTLKADTLTSEPPGKPYSFHQMSTKDLLKAKYPPSRERLLPPEEPRRMGGKASLGSCEAGPGKPLPGEKCS